ncbi:hypothetical protein AB6Q56_14385 [Dechloromonas sp. ARDL1]|uniref:hypothetical protein n=1 Tax=Dechloromonas sp. ARDL1 TaxID=3322121 RepID=UPI003DA704B2
MINLPGILTMLEDGDEIEVNGWRGRVSRLWCCRDATCDLFGDGRLVDLDQLNQ